MKRVVVLLVLVGILASATWPVVALAQEELMEIRYYLLPVDTSVPNYRGPMYLRWRFNPDGLDVRWSCKDYGTINMMVCAVNAEQTDHDFLTAQADVYAWGADLVVQIPQAERSELSTYLEAAWIPADWITPADTRRAALRTVTGMFLFMQRLTAITGDDPLTWGVTLNTQFRNLDQDKQDAIVEAFTTLGYDSSVIKTNWSLRVLFKNAAEQWGAQPIYFGFTTL